MHPTSIRLSDDELREIDELARYIKRNTRGVVSRGSGRNAALKALIACGLDVARDDPGLVVGSLINSKSVSHVSRGIEMHRRVELAGILRQVANIIEEQR